MRLFLLCLSVFVNKVVSRLEHPTRYYYEQSQKRQVGMYLKHQSGKQTNGGVSSLPTVVSTAMVADQLDTLQPTHSGSAPADPDSPLSAGLSSTATSVSEVRIKQ